VLAACMTEHCCIQTPEVCAGSMHDRALLYSDTWSLCWQHGIGLLVCLWW